MFFSLWWILSLLTFRIVSMVMTLREWAHKSLVDETERPDSFLERFRGPANMDVPGPPSRLSRTDSDAENETRRSRCTWGWNIKKKNLYQIYQHTFNPVSLFFISYVRMKKCHLVVLSPSDDAYYYWLIVIGLAVFYNWTLLVVRWEIISFFSTWLILFSILLKQILNRFLFSWYQECKCVLVWGHFFRTEYLPNTAYYQRNSFWHLPRI